MILKIGSTGRNVNIIQRNLKMLSYDPKGIDYIYGENTETAVKNFQSENSLVCDGIVGDHTWNALIDTIKNIQAALNSYGFNLAVDGIAGIDTYNCLLRFQEEHNLTADGIVGQETKNALFKNNNSILTDFDISENGVNFIADYEDFYAEPYRGLDSQNQTIGYGHVIISGEHFESITKIQAKALLRKDLQSFVDIVNTITLSLNLIQCQFDALISFAYNCGISALKNSTLLKDIKGNASIEKIKEDFLMWCNCNGKRELGLYRRRYDEFEMYKDADYTRTYRDF
ncbi:peptidoglycan-binding protein [Clostridium beijerinckii]|uniref:Lysozyme n=1 Tax=Clostridium beijerinckii TaxID=1520 RepID=A0AAW3W856_CLOBE|nr:peptidoglycan-binding protein [Clostridium beijerinckii]MBC2457728.1 glycoside hydrolase family protein [Clostridium beijerinckii]MBC2475080.1 glycoside hydrolase family protein [Clostridium beijerinckii]NOV63549.1 GH24 family phage-related lysozyme (muramidase) [Clostridium beijerinckii]NOV73271.1 GH24 family phage-related lysozyme (muramidase) [Clostridium beijerinckii]NOW35409.1 GH24 family phage-related lysozyme (muramidase) [Clostridium beijerinckii]